MPTFIRQTAMLCTLAELKDGLFIQQSELPSGIKSKRGFLSRVNVLGVIVEKDAAAFVLDDGTSQISVRSFDASLKEIAANVGELVNVIGKPREYNGERYLVLEICKTVKNKQWVEYRKRELAQFSKHEAPQVAPAAQETPTTVEVPQSENPFELIIAQIRKLDTGQGADVQEVLSSVDHAEKDRLLQALMEEGEIFEMRPGRVKVLE